MKLRSKIYLFQSLFTVILFVFLYFTYTHYKEQYYQDLHEYVNDKADFYKRELISSYYKASETFNAKKILFHKIHRRAIELLQEKPDIPLQKLVERLKQEFGLRDIEIDVFMIDKNYVIYKTTFQKDLGFNLSAVAEAKEYLDKTTRDKKIYIADFVSTDALSMEYKLYSYSYLKDGTYLELGFKDKSVYNSFKTTIEKIAKESKVKVYNITKVDGTYVYYDFNAQRDGTKEDFYRQIRDKKSSAQGDVILAYFQRAPIVRYRDTQAVIYAPLFQEDMYRKIGFENIIVQVVVDISSKMEALKRFETLFYVSVGLVLLFLLLLYRFVDRYFTSPIDIIVASMNAKKEVEQKDILQRDDELSTIAKKYNTLLQTLQHEIQTNKTLLEENKRFIADTVHQIRTPLTNIMMNSELIKRNDLSQNSASYVDQINASINMLTNSYEDLSYTISYDTIEYKATLLCLSDILISRVAFFATIAEVNFKKISTDIESGILFKINQIELERLIDNNIANGIKYADAHKPIDVTLKRRDGFVVLEFTTYSRPIQNPQMVFEKNYRENDSKRGLGLGLNMVKIICEKYSIDYGVTCNIEKNSNTFQYIFKEHNES